MELENYFEFEKFGDVERIRLKGHRISIEHVIEPYQDGISPEEIVNKYYPSLTLEKVYATITYYLQHKQAMDAYIRKGNQLAEAAYQEYLKKDPPEVVKRLHRVVALELKGI